MRLDDKRLDDKRLDDKAVTSEARPTDRTWRGEVSHGARTPAVPLLRLTERVEALAHFGSWRMGRASGQVALSPEMFRILGIEPNESGLAAEDVIIRSVHPEDLPRILETFSSLLGGETPRPVEYRIVRPDGCVRWIYSEADQEFDGSGQVVGLLGYVQDITDRRRQEMVAAARLRLVEHATTQTLDELLEETLSEAEALTESATSFLALLADDEKLINLRASSPRTKPAPANGARRSEARAPAGAWVECIGGRRPVIRNDLAHDRDGTGWPEGRTPAVRELVVPVLRAHRVVMVVGVGDKHAPYVQEDADYLARLADLVLDVVDRKRALDDLRRSEVLHRTLMEHAPIAISVLRDGNTLLANEAHRKLFGYSSFEEIDGLGLGDFIAADDRTALLQEIQHRKPEDVACDDWYEVRGLRRDGTTFPMLIGAATVVLPDGPATIIFHENLTDIRRADDALVASEQKFETAFKSAPVLMAIIDVETERIVDVSEEGIRLSGFSRKEMVGRTSRELGWLTPETAAAMREEITKHGRMHGVEMTRRAKDGRPVDILMFADPVIVAGRKSMLFTGMDITERRRAERELAETRALQEAISDSTDDFIWSVDPVSFAMTSFNRNVRDFVKRSRGIDLQPGMMPDELFPTRQRDVWSGYYRQALALGSFQTEHSMSAGRVLSLSLHVLERDGEIFGISVFARDITEARRAEQALRDSEARLRQSEKMEAVGRLAGGIAHDFNNLLTAVGGYAQLLEVDLPEGSPALDDAAQIRNAATRAAALTAKLLAFSGGQPTKPGVVDLAASVRELVPILRRIVPERIEVVEELSATAPILADPSEVDQIVLNLVVNAADAIESSGRIEIRTSTIHGGLGAQRTGDGDVGGTVSAGIESLGPPAAAAGPRDGVSGAWTRLVVSDTGSGMSEETAAHAFEPFFTTKAVGEGTGLGLATVYGVVERLGGSIQIASAPGAGASVVIDLPASADVSPADPERWERPPEPGTERILLVEDEPSVRALTRALLERIGYSVRATATPLEAIEVDADSYDLLISDVVMPGMDGPELARELRSARPDLPVLFVSGYQRRSGQGANLEGPRAQTLPKPFTQWTLAAAVRDALASSQPARVGGSRSTPRRSAP